MTDQPANPSASPAQDAPSNPAAQPGPQIGVGSGQATPTPIPELLPVLPLRETVLFPGVVAPHSVGRPQSLRAVDDAMRTNRLVLAIAQRNAEVEEPAKADLYEIGTVATIVQLLRSPDGGVRIALQGVERVRLVDIVSTDPYLVARVARQEDRVQVDVEVEGLRRAILDLVRTLVPLLGLPPQVSAAAETLEEPLEVAYAVASAMPLDLEARQQVLELEPVDAKLRFLVEALQHEISVRELGQSITQRTQERLTKAQREAILREQLRSIQRELGEGEEGSELDALRHKIEEANPPDEVRREAERELDRLSAIPEASPEHGLIRTWLEWVGDLPWQTLSGGDIDVAGARAVLDEDHYDLVQVKDRILEHLAVRKLRRERGADIGLGGGVGEGSGAGALEGVEPDEPADATVGESSGAGGAASPVPTTPEHEAAREPILCFVGPPGVGKTSLGQSIARALGRKFIRMSLGGVRDEAEIRGHRRTYVGAFPGRVIQGLRRVGVQDPVFMLDEIDKLGADWRGDPTSALLEVLDPAQNFAFTDTYLGVPFDLSQVLFIATANTLDTIPGPLLDRMEILRVAGYTDDEKLQIATRYLVPQQRRAHGLREDEIAFDDEAIRTIIRGYTREAGVRELDRRIAQVTRKVAREIAEGAKRADAGAGAAARTVDANEVEELLGRRPYFEESAERTERPGVATGMAWTPSGGEVLYVEAALIPDERDTSLLLTGMLGDVMKESAQAALTYVRSDGARFGIPPGTFHDKRVHVHVPAGALPKDGPSAGVTMATAIASLALGRPVREGVVMTGEITLRGKVLPVGGVKEKVLAAHRAGLRTIILPRRNEGDLDDLPEQLRRELSIHPVDRVEDAFAVALDIPVPGQADGSRPADAGGPPAVDRAAASGS